MPKVYKARSVLGVGIELELVEKTRNILVFKDTKTGNLYKVSVKKASNGKYIIDVNGVEHYVLSHGNGEIFIDSSQPLIHEIVFEVVHREKELKESGRVIQVEPNILQSPISGRVIEVRVKSGSTVNMGDTVILLESMKMIIEVKSHMAGIVEEVYVQPGTVVNRGDRLLKVKQL
ncbi:MAG: biotin/lipoyl-containing protein [Desulfurococcaceae archaeon]